MASSGPGTGVWVWKDPWMTDGIRHGTDDPFVASYAGDTQMPTPNLEWLGGGLQLALHVRNSNPNPVLALGVGLLNKD